MKTTIELPDAILREAKATAALRGESLRQLFEKALRDHLEALESPQEGSEPWRAFVGSLDKTHTDEVDAAIREDLETIESESWR